MQRSLLLAASLACCGCVAELPEGRGDGLSGEADGAPPAPSADEVDAAVSPDPTPSADAAPPRPHFLCDDDPPPGAQHPPPPPSYSGGACPALLPGRNTLPSSGGNRELILVVPTDLDPAERLPVGFLWHPLGSDADVFLERGELVSAVDQARFIAVLPEAKGDLTLQWPWSPLDSGSRFEEELRFFDDMFACIAAQYNVNLDCVAAGGVSSGGLWATQVGWARGQYFSSLLSVSGGSGNGSIVRSWQGSPHKMPALVLWGGSADVCVIFSFIDTSHTLEQELLQDGHFVLECVHNCGHAIPPFDPPPGESGFAPIWEFPLNHPYWLEDGDSPYFDQLPANLPSWCSVGVGNATPRTGVCDEPSQC